jgi:uncharacterized coiled-coil protein SlyX
MTIMLKRSRAHRSHILGYFLLAVSLFVLGAVNVQAQALAPSSLGEGVPSQPSARIDSAAAKKPETTEEKLSALEQMLLEQSQRLNQMQKTIAEQQETIQLLVSKLNATNPSIETARSTDSAGPALPAGASATVTTQATQPSPIEGRLKKLEAIKIEGDFRLRSESIFGATNVLPSGDNPAAFGNELSARNRMRIRARMKMSGSFGAETVWCKENKCKEFEWGFRLATGSFANNISTNQTLTDFFNRKPFALDQAYISYRPTALGGHLQIQGGKFEPPWSLRYELPWSNPEMMIDNDLMVDGFTESYTHTSKTSKLKELKFVAWQLPMLERNSAFVRNADGTVNVDQSHRDGRDLALYGGQIRARLEPNAKLALHLAASDLYFSGTQFISPVQVFGPNLLLPVTFTIPASGGNPAQTITTQVSIPRDLLVAGNANLGLTTLSNNALNRDGRLASGYNLVNLLARADLKYSQRWPVSLIFNFVTNTQAHGVVRAGPSGADVIIPNHENNGFWAEVQVGKAKERGDLAFAYTFMHLEKDAVLTPFNFSDITQQSDVRVHRVQFGYTAFAVEKDPKVVFSVTGIVTERLNGLFGPFIPTPPGSLNRATTRLQFDTVLRF